MNTESNGPIINSRHHGNLPRPNRAPYIIFGLIVLITLIAGFFFFITGTTIDKPSIYEESWTEDVYPTEVDPVIENTKKAVNSDSLYENTEEATPDFYYDRALKKEKDKDYAGAIEDYDKTIELATNYSSNMFNALNNRGFIKAKHLKDYKAAMTDFDRIIEIEKTKTEYNNSHIEAAYTNRAYVKKMLGNKDGACDDLFEALAYCKPSSTSFIEKQIEKNCW